MYFIKIKKKFQIECVFCSKVYKNQFNVRTIPDHFPLLASHSFSFFFNRSGSFILDSNER